MRAPAECHVKADIIAADSATPIASILCCSVGALRSGSAAILHFDVRVLYDRQRYCWTSIDVWGRRAVCRVPT